MFFLKILPKHPLIKCHPSRVLFTVSVHFSLICHYRMCYASNLFYNLDYRDKPGNDNNAFFPSLPDVLRKQPIPVIQIAGTSPAMTTFFYNPTIAIMLLPSLPDVSVMPTCPGGLIGKKINHLKKIIGRQAPPNDLKFKQLPRIGNTGTINHIR